MLSPSAYSVCNYWSELRLEADAAGFGLHLFAIVAFVGIAVIEVDW